jgi:hypothetical protein
MAKLFCKCSVLMFFCGLIFLDGCKTDPTSDPIPESSFAFLKGLNGQRLKEYDPDILMLIRKDLLDKNDTKLLNRFSRTYDLKTGKLAPAALAYFEANATADVRAKTNALSWHIDWIAQNTSSSDIGGETYPDASGTVIIGASSHWLRGFMIQTPLTYPTTWSASNSFSSNTASDNTGPWNTITPANSWQHAGGWNDVKFDAYWIWVGSQIACYSYYRSLLIDNTTTAWISNGGTCNLHTNGKGIKTIEFKLVDLEGGAVHK